MEMVDIPSSTLVICYIANWKMAIDSDVFPINKCDFPVRYVSLAEVHSIVSKDHMNITGADGPSQSFIMFPP